MRRITLVGVMVAALALVLGASGNDVLGYRSGKNVWLLGAKLKDVNLGGFSEAEVANPNVTAYVDLSRTIQFEQKDTEVSVALFEHSGRLSGVVIAVPPTERPFKSLRTYYAGRLSGCEQTIDEANQSVWCDSEDDFLILIKDRLNDDTPVTLVLYVRGESVLGTSGDTVPQWLRDLLSGE
jgi:hypothetical protein